MNRMQKSFFFMVLMSALPAPIPAGKVVINGKEHTAPEAIKKRRLPSPKKADVPAKSKMKRAPTMRTTATLRKKDSGEQ